MILESSKLHYPELLVLFFVSPLSLVELKLKKTTAAAGRTSGIPNDS